MRSFSRRQLLGAGVALLAGAPLGLRGCRGDAGAATLDAALAGWLDDAHVEPLGRRVLALGAGWNTDDALSGGLGVHLAPGDTPGEARRKLVEAIRDDFRHERMVAVEGWWLAETEARLYALVLLRSLRGAN